MRKPCNITVSRKCPMSFIIIKVSKRPRRDLYAKDDRETEFNELSIKLDALYADKKHGVICNFKNRQKGLDGKEIFRIVFDENDNTPEKVAEFIKSFTDEFKGIIEEVRSVMTATYLPKNLETIPRTCLGSRDRSLHETS